jgi:hypothetical protein
MSRLSQLKVSWNYETNVPRCETCQHMQTARIVLTRDSLTKRVNHLCKLGGFTVTRYACCDKWQGKDGSTVDPLPAIPAKPKPGAPEPKPETHECPNCGKRFATDRGLSDHRKREHPPPRQWNPPGPHAGELRRRQPPRVLPVATPRA